MRWTRRRYDTDVSDTQWAVLEPPAKRPGPGRPREIDLGRVVNALRYLNRTGCQWRLLPKEFANWNTVRYSFDQWSQDGTLERLNEQVRERLAPPS
jgi:putative transposase